MSMRIGKLNSIINAGIGAARRRSSVSSAALKHGLRSYMLFIKKHIYSIRHCAALHFVEDRCCLICSRVVPLAS